MRQSNQAGIESLLYHLVPLLSLQGANRTKLGLKAGSGSGLTLHLKGGANRTKLGLKAAGGGRRRPAALARQSNQAGIERAPDGFLGGCA